MQVQKPFHFNPQNTYNYANNIETSDLCADIGYFLILPFSHEQAHNPKNINTIPYVVTYTDENTKMKIIVEEYKNMNTLAEKKRLQFTLSSGHIVSRNLMIRDLKLGMGGANINGLNLFTYQSKSENNQYYYEDQDSSNQDIYEDQCSVSEYLSGQSGFGSQYITLIAQIPLKNRMAEVFTISVDGESNCFAIIDAIVYRMKKEFGVNVTGDDISQVVNKETQRPIQKNRMIMTQKLYNKSKIEVQLKNPSVQLRRIRTKDYNSYIIIYKEGEKDPKKFKYSEIAQLTFSQLYTTHLELQESKQRKDVCYGLKINDLIIKPNEKISLAEIYFNNQNKDPLNVVAKVVNEKMVFFHKIPSLIKKGQDFVLDDYIEIPKNQEEKRRSVRQLSKKRASTTKNQYFQQQQRLEPILIYTSELRYFEKQQKKQYKIYESLNRFLRENPLLTLQESQLKQQWRYLYSSALLQHLKNIEKFKGKTFRGISYDPKATVGKILTFKQFLSTSVSRNTAISFASKSTNPVKYLFQLEIIQGYPIQQYSIFTKQEEILLEPFTDFQVVKIEDKKEKIKDKEFTFRVFSLKQLQTSKKLPEVKANFVIWIDDKPKEGQLIFSKIDLPLETTILVQIFSTEELVVWLKKNAFLFSDRTANLIFITNMSRVQKGNFNQIAGIQGLREIRKYSSQMPVFFYIGNVDKANEKLLENKVDTKNVLVGNSGKEVFKFITMKINQKNEI